MLAFLYRIALCLCALSSYCNWALAQRPDLKSRIDALATEIRAASAPNPELKASLKELRDAISALEFKAPDDGATFINRVEDLLPVIDRLAKGGATIAPPLATAVSQLIAATQRLEVSDLTKVSVDRAKALLAALKSKEIIASYPTLQSAVAELFPELEGLEAVNFFKAVERRSTSLTRLLATAGTTAPPISVETIDKVTKLEAQLLAYRKHGQPNVDIVYATYGDMRDHNSPRPSGQTCDATAAMRKKCQGQPKCELPASPETSLCNADPAPYIPIAHKGAWILFRCVDALLNVYTPPALPSMIPSRGNTAWVPLRSTAEEFTCTPPRLAEEVVK